MAKENKKQIPLIKRWDDESEEITIEKPKNGKTKK